MDISERTPPRAQLTADFSKHLLSLRAISNLMRFELWQIILMLREEFIGHLANFCERQDRRCERVVADGAINHHRVAFDGTSNCHLFDATGELREQCTFSGERANIDWVETSLVHNDGNFYTRALRKIGDEIRVANVAIELEHLAASEGVNDVRSVLMFALQVFGRERLSKPLFDLILPRGFIVLIFFENVRVLTRVPACAMCAIFFEKVGALAEPRIVFRVVSARFSNIFSKREIHFIADWFVVINFWSLGDGFMNQRIRVHAIPLVLEIPRLMIDPCT